MRRFVVAAIAVGGLSIPAPAGAHTLPFAHARADVTKWARTIASTTQSYAWGVGACRRLSPHAVACDYWTDGPGARGENPTTIHCIGVMEVRYVGAGFYREHDYPVVSCAVRGS